MHLPITRIASYRRTAVCVGLCVLAWTACAREGRETPAVDDTSAEQVPDATVVAQDRATAWQLTSDGIGPVHAGMSLSEASAEAGARPHDPATDAPCRYVTFAPAPDSVAFMIVGDTVRRVDVRGGEVRTDRGVGVGDPTSRVVENYGARLERQPHKYVADGAYLIHSSLDGRSAVVFEIEADTVVRMRSGRSPQVMWVEGCG